MRIIHSTDWQIGKVFKQFGAKEETLRQARLSAIERLGVHARENGVRHVLVAGDVYDSEAPSAHTLRAPIERMKTFGDVHWHLLPGNHDPHRPEDIWDRVAQLGVPENIHLHLPPIPATLDENAALLPAPLLRKSEFDDITAWMELGVLSSQCLDRRIPDKQTLVEEIAAWEHDRNANHTKANRQFSTPNARIKLKHLYPAI